MPYCPNCGSEHEAGHRFCNSCGEEFGESSFEGHSPEEPQASNGTGSEEWSWLDPKGPFRSPRTALNYFNGVGLVLIFGGLLLVVVGVDSPYAFLPDPLPIVLVVYLLIVIFVGLPLAGILLLTDNVLGFLRHG